MMSDRWMHESGDACEGLELPRRNAWWEVRSICRRGGIKTTSVLTAEALRGSQRSGKAR